MRKDTKIAFITGAAGGLGQAVLKRLLAQNYLILASDVDYERLVNLIETNHSDAVVPYQLDVTDEANWQQVAAQVRDTYGQIDVLFNNAGIFQIKTIEATSLELWQQTMAVNATSAFLGIKTMSGLLKDGSSVINTCSIASFLGSRNRIAYAASKGAVGALTKAAAIELAPRGIRVNSVHPAYMNTQMAAHAAVATHRTKSEMGARIPLHQRISTPDEVAGVVAFLASADSGFMTGSEVVVDGGQSVN